MSDHSRPAVFQKARRQGRERKEPPWSAAPHSTFAVTDRTTAVAEGYAIQLEAVWAHFGRDSAQRAFYHRLRPPDVRGTSAAFYFPANDLLNFAQTWGRYAAVRDGLAAFEAHAYDGDLVRSQYDPARDRSTLRRPSAMVASEGVAASTLFWAGSEYATLRGAEPGGGLGLSVLMAQREILRAMRTSVGAADMWRPDLIDVITSFGENGSRDRRNAIGRFVDVTKGVTALPSLRLTWATFYHGAIRLDFDATARATATLDSARAEIASAALTDESMLRRGLGPVLPVRADNLGFRLVAFGNATSVELDLNAVSEPELRALPRVDDVMRQQIRAALDRAPFVSVADFETRVGRPLAALGLTVVPVSR